MAGVGMRLVDYRSTWVQDAYALYRDSLYRTARKLTPNAADAEDVLQNAFLGLYSSDGELPEVRDAYFWLRAMVKREAVDSYRKRNGRYGQRHEVELPDLPIVSPPLEQRLDHLAQSQAIWRSLPLLSPRERMVIYLGAFREYTTVEIADTLDINPHTVHTHVSNARRKLRTILIEAVR